MNINDLNTPVLSGVEGIEQLEQFLTGSQAVAFPVPAARMSTTEAYSVRWFNSDTPR